MDKSRQQFETWFNDEYKTTMKDYDEPLVKFVRKQLFIVWQASRESLEVELPDCIEYDKEYLECDYEEGYRKGYNNSLSECRQALISNGVKIKNG